MNKNMKILLAIFTITFAVACIDYASAYTYQISYYSNSANGTTATTNPTAFYARNVDYLLLNTTLYATYYDTGSPFSYIGSFKIPYSTTYATTSDTGSGTSICKYLAETGKYYSANEVIENRNVVTNDANTFYAYTMNELTATTPNRILELFNDNVTDSELYATNIYASVGCDLSGSSPANSYITSKMNGNQSKLCGSMSSDRMYYKYTTAGTCSSGSYHEYGFIIFNSTTGNINYSIKLGGANAGKFLLYKMEDSSSPTTLCASASTCSGSLPTLTPSTIYVIGYGVETGYAQSRTAPIFNISIDLGLPNYVCGDWSECVEGRESRICIDSNGLQPQNIEQRECFITPSIGVSLGFEDFFVSPEDTFMCGKSWGLCLDQLYLKDSSLPKDWYLERTYATELFGTTASLENFCEGSSETSFKGSKSLKCWSLPPSSGQPLPVSTFLGDDVTCGDYNQTREPEVVGLFNESLFIAYNVSFATPYVNLRWATKKCSSAPIQYKYGNCFGCCGDKCYGDCNQTPTGWYKIKMADVGEGIYGYQQYPYTAMRYSPYLEPTTLDYTTSASSVDSDTTIINLNYAEEGEYTTLTLNEGNFTEDMVIAFYINPTIFNTDVPVYLTDITGTVIYGSFVTPSSIFAWDWRNVTLQNLTFSPTNIIYIHEPADNNPASVQFYVDYISIETFEHFVEVETLFEFDEEATADWSQKMLDLTNLGIVPNHNYTIGFKISPQYETTASNCLYFDDVAGTYTETTVSVCESYCDGYTQYEAREYGDICLYTIIENAPKCRGVSEEERYDSFCEGTTLNYFDNSTGFWYQLQNATECVEAEEAPSEEDLYQPPAIIGSILDAFGATEGSELEGVRFFLSTFMLATYLILIVGAGLTILPFAVAPKTSVNVSQASALGITGVFVMTLAVTVGGFYPQWIGWTIVVFTGVLLAYLGREIFTKNT
jgi:hypothetical protein